MKRMLPLILVLAAVCLCSCVRSHATYLRGQIGKTCKVQFKRNALGGGATLPVSPTTDSINGAVVSVSGTLKAVEHQAIVLASGNQVYWIPEDAILMVVSEQGAP